LIVRQLGKDNNAIAIIIAEPSRFLLNVPKFVELDYPEFKANVWYGVMVRSDTPPSLVKSLLNAKPPTTIRT